MAKVRTREIARQFHATMTSSFTICSRMSLGLFSFSTVDRVSPALRRRPAQSGTSVLPALVNQLLYLQPAESQVLAQLHHVRNRFASALFGSASGTIALRVFMSKRLQGSLDDLFRGAVGASRKLFPQELFTVRREANRRTHASIMRRMLRIVTKWMRLDDPGSYPMRGKISNRLICSGRDGAVAIPSVLTVHPEHGDPAHQLGIKISGLLRSEERRVGKE